VTYDELEKPFAQILARLADLDYFRGIGEQLAAMSGRLAVVYRQLVDFLIVMARPGEVPEPQGKKSDVHQLVTGIAQFVSDKPGFMQSVRREMMMQATSPDPWSLAQGLRALGKADMMHPDAFEFDQLEIDPRDLVRSAARKPNSDDVEAKPGKGKKDSSDLARDDAKEIRSRLRIGFDLKGKAFAKADGAPPPKGAKTPPKPAKGDDARPGPLPKLGMGVALPLEDWSGDSYDESARSSTWPDARSPATPDPGDESDTQTFDDEPPSRKPIPAKTLKGGDWQRRRMSSSQEESSAPASPPPPALRPDRILTTTNRRPRRRRKLGLQNQQPGPDYPRMMKNCRRRRRQLHRRKEEIHHRLMGICSCRRKQLHRRKADDPPQQMMCQRDS
jgi:hypothetical protein